MYPTVVQLNIIKALTSLYNSKVCSHSIDTNSDRNDNIDLFQQWKWKGICSLDRSKNTCFNTYHWCLFFPWFGQGSPIFCRGHIIDTRVLPHQVYKFPHSFFRFLRHVVFPVQWKSPTSDITWREFLVRLSSVYAENRYPIRLKKSDFKITRIRAYGSAPYISLNFGSCRIRIRAYGFLA